MVIGLLTTATFAMSVLAADVVPGLEGPGATSNVASIAFMRKYIAHWDANVAWSPRNSECS